MHDAPHYPSVSKTQMTMNRLDDGDLTKIQMPILCSAQLPIPWIIYNQYEGKSHYVAFVH